VDSPYKLYLNTGVPHSVIAVEHLDEFDVSKMGAKIRNSFSYNNGTNVCFFEVEEVEKQQVKARFFERGVEGETLCCGTGVMAIAVACNQFYAWSGKIIVNTRGGKLNAGVDKGLKNLYYQGEVKLIYQGVTCGES